MTMPPAALDRAKPHAGALFVFAVVLTMLTEAIPSTVLALGRGYIIGDIYATPDEFAWLDVGYTTSKLTAFFLAASLIRRFSPLHLLVRSTLVMGAACGVAAMTTRLDLLIALRVIQGLSGGILLVTGQTLLFLTYPSSRQPLIQALFAVGAVVAPATIAPALQGWLLDSRSWEWIFLSVVPTSLAAAGTLMIANVPSETSDPGPSAPFDWVGLLMIAVVVFSATYVLTQGNRWDWFAQSRIRWLTGIGCVAALAFSIQQAACRGAGLFDPAIFQSEDFCFAMIASLVAGAALFGSSFLIPAFAVSVLSFTPTDAGQLLLPSGLLFVCSLLIVAFLIQARGIAPVVTVPLGILMIMVAMWMLSGSTSESGASDMMPAILLRGFGLGFIFLSITLIAFSKLGRAKLASGIGLFNAGRQLGGLMGVGGLQTLIDHGTAANVAVLGTKLSAGVASVDERLTATTAMLVGKGMDMASASQAAIRLLDRILIGQSTVIAFDTAFNAVAVLFVVAAPVLIGAKILLHRRVASASTIRI
jgi:DHA2 family multidrug resistance protein